MALTADERRALVVLAAAGQNGVTQRLLSAYGFAMPVIAWLVNRGLATMALENVRAGGQVIEVERVRITDAGRQALAVAEGG
jgi:hypothetical protein